MTAAHDFPGDRMSFSSRGVTHSLRPSLNRSEEVAQRSLLVWVRPLDRVYAPVYLKVTLALTIGGHDFLHHGHELPVRRNNAAGVSPHIGAAQGGAASLIT